MSGITHKLVNRLKSVANLIAAGLKAKRTSGRGLLSQYVEMARLRRLPNRISPSEYYDFDLYDDRKLDWAAKRRFLGWQSPVITGLQPPSWHALANDKSPITA